MRSPSRLVPGGCSDIRMVFRRRRSFFVPQPTSSCARQPPLPRRHPASRARMLLSHGNVGVNRRPTLSPHPARRRRSRSTHTPLSSRARSGWCPSRRRRRPRTAPAASAAGRTGRRRSRRPREAARSGRRWWRVRRCGLVVCARMCVCVCACVCVRAPRRRARSMCARARPHARCVRRTRAPCESSLIVWDLPTSRLRSSLLLVDTALPQHRLHTRRCFHSASRSRVTCGVRPRSTAQMVSLLGGSSGGDDRIRAARAQ